MCKVKKIWNEQTILRLFDRAQCLSLFRYPKFSTESSREVKIQVSLWNNIIERKFFFFILYICLPCFSLLDRACVLLSPSGFHTKVGPQPISLGVAACTTPPTQHTQMTHSGLSVPLWGDRAPSVSLNKGNGSSKPHLPPNQQLTPSFLLLIH